MHYAQKLCAFAVRTYGAFVEGNAKGHRQSGGSVPSFREYAEYCVRMFSFSLFRLFCFLHLVSVLFPL